MNFVGKSVVFFVKFYNIVLEVILIVYDELDMNFGVICLKIGGGYGGYNGLCDIVFYIGLNFYCLCIGIGYFGLKECVLGYVLSKVLSNE